MRLLTHNYLRSNVKGTTKGYPLKIQAESLVEEESPCDSDMIRRILPKIDYAALRSACQQLEPACQRQGMVLPSLPETLPEEEEVLRSDAALQADLHRVLFDIHVLEGFLVCPDTGRQFPIKDGIPNMILHEDEL